MANRMNPADPSESGMRFRDLLKQLRIQADHTQESLAEAASVGEYLSVTAGRVLRSMAGWRHDFADGRAAIDEIGRAHV